VNNAGINGSYGPIPDTDNEAARNVLEIRDSSRMSGQRLVQGDGVTLAVACEIDGPIDVPCVNAGKESGVNYDTPASCADATVGGRF
jgi:hypothetical protein